VGAGAEAALSGTWAGDACATCEKDVEGKSVAVVNAASVANGAMSLCIEFSGLWETTKGEFGEKWPWCGLAIYG